MTEESFDWKTADPDTVELTEEEVQDAIRIATDQKRAKIREYQYKLKLAQEPKSKEYSADEYWQMFVSNVGKDFEIDKWNKNIISALCLYFAKDPEFETLKEGFSLRKGCLIYGPFGCGKSSIMAAFRVNQNMSYQCHSVLRIEDEYQRNGVEALERFYKYSDLPAEATAIFRHKWGGYCFDDIGQEETEKAHYANRINVVSEILKRRYYLDIPFNYTHATTNADSEEMGTRYPFLKNSGRLKEMFNFIKFHENAPNRRK